MVTTDCKVCLLRPEEKKFDIKDVDTIGGLIEGAKVYGDSIIMITNRKKIYVVEDVSDFAVDILSDTPYGNVKLKFR
jgi:hypothetical protein